MNMPTKIDKNILTLDLSAKRKYAKRPNRKTNYPEDNLWKKFENHTLNEGLSDNRKKKLLNMYNVCGRGLNLQKATRKEVETFVNALNRNEFKTQDSKNYSGNAKADIKKFLKQFFKWYKGNNEFYPPEVSWIKTRIAKDERPIEKDILTKEQVVKLANAFQKYDFKMLTLFLFDSGFRIQEMLSVKKSDLNLIKVDDEGNECFFIKCNVSKTFTRDIDIPLFTEEIKAYVNSEEFKAKDNDAILFDILYNSYNDNLKVHALKLFNKKISPHNLRHSSATYYADVYNGNVVKLASRFGWSYAAEELQTYVRMSKSVHRDNAKIVMKNDVITLKQENESLKDSIARLEKKQIETSKKVEKLITFIETQLKNK
jgi:integrase